MFRVPSPKCKLASLSWPVGPTCVACATTPRSHRNAGVLGQPAPPRRAVPGPAAQIVGGGFFRPLSWLCEGSVQSHGFSCCPSRLIPTGPRARSSRPRIFRGLCSTPASHVHVPAHSSILGHPGQQAINVISNLARSVPRHLVIRLCTHPSFISPTAAVLSRVAARPEGVPSDTPRVS